MSPESTRHGAPGGASEHAFGEGDGTGDGTGDGDLRFARVIADLTGRLRPLCRDWDAGEFEALVHRIAQRKVRWAETEGY